MVPLSPHPAGDVGDEFEFAAHIVPGKEVSRSGGSKAALRAYRKFFCRHVFGSFVDLSQQVVFWFHSRLLGRNQAEDNRLAFGHETERLETARTLGVKL